MSESRRTMTLYVRTRDKVLLRFEDIETLTSWIQNHRISVNDEFFAADQTWQPLHRLFRVEIAPNRAKPAADAETHAPASRAPEPEGPTRITSAAPASPPSSAKALHSREPVQPGGPWQVRSAVAPDAAGLWGSEPDTEPRPYRFKKRTVIGTGIVVVVAGVFAVILWLGTRDAGSSDSEQPPPAVPSTSTTTAAESRVRIEPVAAGAPDVAPPPAENPPEAPAQDERRAPTPASEASRVVPEPPAPRVPAEPRTPAPAPAPREPEALTYDQHMAEGQRLLARDPANAMKHFQAASAKSPGSVEPVAKMGTCAERLGRLQEAVTLFQKALSLHADYGPAIAGLARVKARLGQREEAAALYTRYLENNPTGSHAAEARAFLAR